MWARIQIMEDVLEEPRVEKETSNEREVALGKIYDAVDKRYEASMSGEKLARYKEHYREVIDKAVELGKEAGLDRGELAMVEVAAGLHDLTKGDAAPEGTPDSIKGIYWLVAHGETAAGEVDDFLNKNTEVMDYLRKENEGFDRSDEDIGENIKVAIKSHMGPHPGFMSEVQGFVNSELEAAGIDPIEHPRPPEGDRVSEVLLAADMRSLAGPGGVQKVMGDRLSNSGWKNEDEKNASEMSGRFPDLDFSTGEMAFKSAFDSGMQAVNMIKNPRDRAWIKGALYETIDSDFDYGDEKISPRETLQKFARYSELVEARGNVDPVFGITAQSERKQLKATGKSYRELLGEARGYDEMTRNIK